MKNESSTSGPSIVSLLRNLRDEGSTLLHQEISLAKAEMSEKAVELTNNAVQLSIGGFVAYAGGIIVLLGIADLVAVFFVHQGLTQNTAMWLARSIIGIIVSVVGWLMVSRARARLLNDTFVPEKTIDSIEETSRWAEQKLQTSHEAAH